MQIEVTRAGAAESAACLALLPRVRDLEVELLLARLDGRLAGAAAVVWRSSPSPLGLPTLIEVIPAFRRRGVGRRLLSAAAEMAAGEGCGLWTLQPLAAGEDAALFAARCGAVRVRTRRVFEVPAEELTQRLAPLNGRLAAGADGAVRIVGLQEAPLEALAQLSARNMGEAGAIDAAQLAARIGRPGDVSVAAMAGSRPVGLLLVAVTEGVCEVALRVVDADRRGGLVNLAMISRAFEMSLAAGARRIRFDADERAPETLVLARRLRATEAAARESWYYAAARA